MILKFTALSEKEKEILSRYAPLLSQRADGFVSNFCETIRKNEKFSSIVRENSIDRMKTGLAEGYRGILAADNKSWNEKLRQLSFLHHKIGLSPEDLFFAYDLFHEDMKKGVDSLGISDEEKYLLEMAIIKRIQRDIFIHVNGFRDIQKRELVIRESFYRGLTDTSRMYAKLDSRPLEEALKNLAEILVEDIDAKLAWIGMIRPGEKWLKILAVAGDAVDYAKKLRISMDPEIPEGRGPAGITLRSKKPFVMNDFKDPRFVPWFEMSKKHGLGASANTAFRTHDGRMWAISLYNEAGRKFPEHIEDLLTDLAINLELFIENKEKALDLERIREYQSALEEIQKELLTNPSPESIYSLVVRMLAEHTDAHNIRISVFEEGSEWVKTMTSTAKIANTFVDSRIIPKSPSTVPDHVITARVLRTGKAMIIKEPGKDPEFRALWSKYPSFKVRSVGCWPIFEGDDEFPVAALTIGSRDPDYFRPDLQNLIVQMTASIEIAINQYRQRKNIEWMGLHDPLTDLPNRLYFEQSATEAMARAKRSGKKLAVGIMDLDRFKKWNDTFGHTAGDDLLRKIAKDLQAVVRAGDGVARIGGDEFVFHISFENPEDLKRVSERLLRAVSANKRGKIALTCSLGWSVYPNDDTSLRTLLIQADQVMYSSKRKSEDTYRVFERKKTDRIRDNE